MKYVNSQVLSAADTSSQNGNQIDANQLISASFHAYFGDGSANGTVKIQGSNDITNQGYNPDNFVVSNWTDVPNASASITSGASALITINQLSYRWLRVVYTRSSGGSSTVTANMFGISI